MDGGFQGGGAAGHRAAAGALHEGVGGACFNNEAFQGVGLEVLVHEGGEGFRGRRDGKAQVGMLGAEESGCGEEEGKELGDLAAAAAGKEADEVGFAGKVEAAGLVVFHEGVAAEDGGQADAFVEGFFEGKDADHEVEPLRHFGDAAAVPGPNLGADVVDEAAAKAGAAQGGGEPQVEARVVDEDDGAGLEG